MTRTPSWLRRWPEGSIWALAIAVLALSAGLVALHVGSLDGITRPHLPWWVLALGFAAGERAVIHLHFRRSSHSFTLGDIPMVLGLLFASAPDLLLGALLGSAAIWILERRLPPLKVVYNLAQLALAICVAETIVHAYTNGVHSLHPLLWLFVFLAVQAGAVVSVALVSAAITLSEGTLPEGMLQQMFGVDLLTTIAGTALALSTAIVVKADAIGVALMAVPAIAVYVAYRAYLTERQRHEKLEFLYDVARTLSQSPDVMASFEGLLERAREAFRVEIAELVLFSSSGQAPLRVSMPAAPEAVTVDAAVAEGLREVVEEASPAVLSGKSSENEQLNAYLQARGVTHGLVALLPGDGAVVGTLMLANRVGVVRSFDTEDLKLLGALATNCSVSLQFDRLEQAVWQLRELQEQLDHQSSHDVLTGLANRTLFGDQTKRALERQSGSVAVLLIDVDDFKTVNETLGHAAGDELLIALAQRLGSAVLPVDLVARLGGDEFGVLLRDVDDPAQAGIAVADRIGRALEAPMPVAGKRAAARVSIGIATGRAGYEDADELLGNADVAMYHAKRSGKGRSALFEPRMRSAAVERHSIKFDLERALERGQLRVDYQPIIALGNRQIVAAEALIRWQRQYGKLLAASEFIPLAQETGLIGAFGEFVLAEACRQAREWLARGTFETEIAVHVNLSSTELDDPLLASRVTSALEQTGLPPHLLVFEISESSVLRDLGRATTQLTELERCGVRLALDDFGSGHSSLTYLRSLPFSSVKVGRPFVEGLTSGPREVAFVRTTRELCEGLGLSLAACGIETQEQLDLLLSLGCDFGQGFLIGRPAAGQSLFPTSYARSTEPGAWVRGLVDEP